MEKGIFTAVKELSPNLPGTQEEVMDMSDENQSEKEKQRILNGRLTSYLTSVFKVRVT
jgi:hypothetical protein